MNSKLKVGIAALALASITPAFAAEEVEEPWSYEEDGAYGWTVVAIGLATPVQLPWGWKKWDVFGLDLNVFYTDVPKMGGLGIGGLGMTTRDPLWGMQVSGLCNWGCTNVYGARFTLGANICQGVLYGLDAGGFGWHKEVCGADIELVATMQEEVTGGAISLIGNFSEIESYGCTIAGGVNLAGKAYGGQVAGIFNMADELHGCQIGLVNYARECPWGFQIGLINIIMDNKLKVLPIVNAYF